MIFDDRRDAGRHLAHRLQSFRGQLNTIVLALPRGGVPVAYEVASELQLPLDILLVRKLGVPGREELAMGALTSNGTLVLNQDIIRHLAIPAATIEAVAERERSELERREHEYRSGHQPLAMDNQTIILIDDGLATGASMRAALQATRPNAQRIVIAIPVAANSSLNDLSHEADQIISVHTPEDFEAVGQFYRDFHQVTDEEVRTLLTLSRQNTPDHASESTWRNQLE